MDEARCERIRMWRWRRSPLRRRCDLVEAWVVLCGWVLALVGGALAGIVAVGAVERSAEEQRSRSRLVSAVLVENADDKVPSRVPADYRVWATVRWTGPDGQTHTDDARVAPKTKAGATVRVWTDGHGQVTAEPLSGGEIRLHAVSGGTLAALCTAGLVLGSLWALRQLMERRRLEQWALEWERIDTRNGWKTG
ncbi:Rv1733c family protein [Streptomyces sp. NPDC003635]